MIKKVILISLAAAVLFSCSSPSIAEEEPVNVNPHDYGRKELCSLCHAEDGVSLNFDPVTTCTKCHSGNVANHPVSRHPIGKVPKIAIPEILPLTKDRQIVCYTCHDPHNKSKHIKMLRVDFLKLCASCHVGY